MHLLVVPVPVPADLFAESASRGCLPERLGHPPMNSDPTSMTVVSH